MVTSFNNKLSYNDVGSALEAILVDEMKERVGSDLGNLVMSRHKT
jgi:hypothetical protein